MRCQKVRSYLSAYCRGELPERQRRLIAGHLDVCAECRREEAISRELAIQSGQLAQYKVSDDFKAQLLDRIARERFKETRSKAYFPKRIPIFYRTQLIPVAASLCLVMAFVFFGGLGDILHPDRSDVYVAEQSSDGNLDDRYMYVQPQADHALVQHARANWEFKKQLARVNRIKDLMNQVADQNYFTFSQPLPGKNQLAADGLSAFMQNPFEIIAASRANRGSVIRNAAEVQ